MLNTTNIRLGSNSQTVSFNATSTGMMQRSNPNSIFIRFPKDCKLARMVFPDNGDNPYVEKFYHPSSKYEKYKETNGKIEVTVLQVLIFGQDEFLCEVLDNLHLKVSTEAE
jgi:hypothetical protein